MKLLLGLALALFMVAAPAQTLSMPNSVGGKIVLTQNRPCPPELPHFVDGRIAFSYGNRLVLRGCWRIVDGVVAMLWEDGDLRLYRLGRFTSERGT